MNLLEGIKERIYEAEAVEDLSTVKNRCCILKRSYILYLWIFCKLLMLNISMTIQELTSCDIFLKILELTKRPSQVPQFPHTVYHLLPYMPYNAYTATDFGLSLIMMYQVPRQSKSGSQFIFINLCKSSLFVSHLAAPINHLI